MTNNFFLIGFSTQQNENNNVQLNNLQFLFLRSWCEGNLPILAIYPQNNDVNIQLPSLWSPMGL